MTGETSLEGCHCVVSTHSLWGIDVEEDDLLT